MSKLFALLAFVVFGLAAGPAGAQSGQPPATDGVFVATSFKFHSGEVLGDVKLAYKTLGNPANPAVLVLHGTAGSAQNMLSPGFAGAMFGDGQPLDASKYYIILPDALGAGKSAKPSDGMKSAFPRYNYDDMVEAQYRLVTEHLKIPRLRLVIGNSMGGMHAWLWAVRYPDMMDAVVPMASQPTEMSGRNWMTRRLLIETIKADPEYQNGQYATQPKLTKLAGLVYATGTNGGDIALQAQAPTRAAADALVDKALAQPFTADANDYLYQWDASRDYNPEPLLGKIKARVLVINSADDERNPPHTGILDAALKKIPTARLLLIPASAETAGHGTTGSKAKMYAKDLAAFLDALPKS